MEYLIGGIFISVVIGLLPVMIQFKSQVNNGAFNKLIKIKRFSFLFSAPGQDPVSKIGVALPIFISQLLGYVLLVVFTTLNILFYFISEEMFITMMTITIYVLGGEAIILVIFNTILLLLSRPKEYFKRHKIDRKKITYSDYIIMLLYKKDIGFWYNGNEYHALYPTPNAVTMRVTEYSNGEATHKYEEKFSSIIDLQNNFRIDGKPIAEIWDDVTF